MTAGIIVNKRWAAFVGTVRHMVRRAWHEATRPMTPEEERRWILWNEAQCGVKRCPKCGARQ
jgi:hypothetical protein